VRLVAIKISKYLGLLSHQPFIIWSEATMELPVSSPLPHRNFPTIGDILHHQWREVIETSQPNSISANSLAFPDFLESTSTWNQRHIIAFHMLDFNDLPLNYLYPQEFYPTADDLVIIEVKKVFILSQNDIRKGNNMIQTGVAFSFYQALQDCLRTQQKTPSPPQVMIRPQRVSQPQVSLHQSNLSSSSGSSFLPSISSVNVVPAMNLTGEDKAEAVTNILVINYLYLLAALENTMKEASSRKNLLFRYIRLSPQ
jgi:hypothetical protein